ncbi:MAG: aminodeoxychorismate/anthranilate synthase component II [Planctomycetes bacterium]|nr:aminodeoxychorismate/anthranilate synthase component II [Planctomycetota bacterium]
MRIVILDNYDSFSYNLYQLVGELAGDAVVVRNDAATAGEIERMEPDRILISPGPGRPEIEEYFGICARVILRLGLRVPILGVCLGHQGIVHAFGGRIVRAPEPRHGKTSPVHHDGRGIFAGLPSPFEAMRYHSLVADPERIPSCLEVSAWSRDGIVMAVRHKEWPVEGVQFHPESIGTPCGREILSAFLGVSARVPG